MIAVILLYFILYSINKLVDNYSIHHEWKYAWTLFYFRTLHVLSDIWYQTEMLNVESIDVIVKRCITCLQ